MNLESQIRSLEQITETLVSEKPGFFLVGLKVNPGNHIKVFIDADQGISIDDLAQYNRTLYKQIEESRLFPTGDFTLEVSSPGLDEPLKLLRQYEKNIGRYVEVIRKDGIKTEGKLMSVTPEAIVVEEEKGHKKQKELVAHTILFENIKSTKIQIKW
jgi:ribosome maturation factor RimP